MPEIEAIDTMIFPGVFLAVVGLLIVATPASAQNADHGAQDYKLCASCHGFRGEGNQLVSAPAIAGLESWYLERQLRNFRDGIRGHADDDQPGKTMAQMTRGLESDTKIADVVAYIGTLPDANPKRTLDGDEARGSPAYAACAACHGANAAGNEALNAPGLIVIDDWYQLAQLKKFHGGQRGALAADIYGQQMAPMAKVLPDEQAMKDVIAYIRTLQE